MAALTEIINSNLIEYEIEYRTHATRRMFQRNIGNDEVESILINGQIIERYDDDFPLPSLLLNGRTSVGRPLHVVVAINLAEKKLIIITTYEPDLSGWTNDFSRRLR
jgi:hypothetical protein